MIAGTFAISGLLLLLTAYLFAAGYLTPVTQTIAWFSIFFFASAAASSAYLTASEIFPLETRALAIACFYALGISDRRKHLPASVWLAHRVRIGLEGECRICIGCRVASACRSDGIGAGNRC
jgi:hypothetical protein